MIPFMKRIMLALAAAALAAPAAAAERRYTVTDFDRIQIEGPFEVTLSTGRPSSAVASGSNDAIDRLSLDVQGRILRIRAKQSTWSPRGDQSDGSLKIALGTHDLRAATVIGSGSLAVDRAKAARFDASLSGSGQLTLGAVETDNLIVRLLGSGKIGIGGKAKSVRATIQGSGDLDARGLQSEDLVLNSETSGDVAIAARRTAKVAAGGAGDTQIIGKPACMVSARGSGRVACGD
jgi:hypothetical protein